MTAPPDLSPDEPLRLQSLRDLQLIETPIEERFERLTRLLQGLLATDIAAISLVEADRQFFKSIQGLDTCGTSRDVSFCGHAILGDDLMVVPDARLDERFVYNPLVTGPPHIVAYASIPLHSPDGHCVGSLCAIDSKPRNFTEDELQHLRDLGALAESELRVSAANAVQAALVEEINVEQRRALIDPLTRLWNREGIMRCADEAFARRKRTDSGASVLMIDLDKFKQINDTHGHCAGDEVLKTTARRILAGLRDTDAVGRVGGDEFLAVMDDCDSLEGVQQVAQRVCERVSSEPVQTDAGPIQITISLGVGFAKPGWTGALDELIKSADLAMYDCKRTGRNGISTAPDSAQAA